MKMEFKQVFRNKWREGLRRELLVVNILNILLPADFKAVLTGIGGSAEFIDESHSNPLNAFDITIFDKTMRAVAFIDVTGVRSQHDYEKKKGLCVGAWKLWKAERYNVTERTWFIHVLDEKISLRFINYNRLRKLGSISSLNEAYGVTGQFYCCDSHYWLSFKEFRKWLTGMMNENNTCG